MNVSRLLGATMVAGAGPSGGGQADRSATQAAHAPRITLLRRARARRGSRRAPQPGPSIAKAAR
jgi:hypothetical protein